MIRFKKTTSRLNGFTLIELGIVLALLAILIAIMVPNVKSYIQKTRIARAKKECRSIADGILRLHSHTKFWPQTRGPINGAFTRDIDILFDGPCPQPDPTCPGNACDGWQCGGPLTEGGLSFFLGINDPENDFNPNQAGDFPTTGRFKWQGPYVNGISANSQVLQDPWGHSYLVNARYFPNNDSGQSDGHVVFVLSAGPDGLIQTYADDSQTNEVINGAVADGDDIGWIVVTND